MADWSAIKTEYITTQTSYRKLADKYGVHKDTIARRAKDESWADSRRHHTDKVQTKLLEADTKKKVTRAERLKGVADKLLDAVDGFIDAAVIAGVSTIDTQSMKHLSGVLKDLKEIQGIKSDLDRQEQEAKIAQLRRQANLDDDEDDGIGVIILPPVKEDTQ